MRSWRGNRLRWRKRRIGKISCRKDKRERERPGEGEGEEEAGAGGGEGVCGSGELGEALSEGGE